MTFPLTRFAKDAAVFARAAASPDRRLRRLVILALLGLALMLAGALGGHAAPARAAGGLFIVNGGGDDTSWDFALTLREAILVADGGTGPGGLNRNVSDAEKAQLTGCTFAQDLSALPFSAWLITGGCGAGGDIIRFDPTVTQVSLTGPLPNLTAPGTQLQGRSPDGTSFLWPLIDGSGMPGTTCSDGIVIAADNVEVSVLTIVNVRTDSLLVNYSCADVLVLDGKNVVVENNVLGETRTSTACYTDGVSRNAAYGIHVLSNLTASSGVPLARISMNTIGCHPVAGVLLERGANYVSISPGPSQSVPLPNYIGTDPLGRTAMPNGVGILTLPPANGIGVDSPFISGNVVSGNTGDGIVLHGVTNGSVRNNVIGLTDVDGGGNRLPLGNGGSGIRIEDSAFTGIDAEPVLNGTSSALIAANTGDGITIVNSTAIEIGNLLSSQLVIGTPLLTTSVPPQLTLACRPCWGNGGYGIWLDSATSSSSIYAKTVSCNGKAGIATQSLAGANTILPFVVALNGGLPIDVADDGPTALSYPTLTTYTAGTVPPALSGTGCANCQTAVYIAIGDPARAGGGGLRLGTVANTAAAWTLQLPNITTPPFTSWVPNPTLVSFTALEVDAGDNSYELSPRPMLFLPTLRK